MTKQEQLQFLFNTYQELRAKRDADNSYTSTVEYLSKSAGILEEIFEIMGFLEPEKRILKLVRSGSGTRC